MFLSNLSITRPGFATELMHLYLATELRPAHEDRLGPDEDEQLILERMPLEEAVRRVVEGGFADGKSVAGILWAAHVVDAEGDRD